MKIRVFTDGACSSNGKKNARASYAFWFPEHKELSNAAVVPADHPQTNNCGELLAILECVKKTEESFPASDIDLQIYTDSTYSKNCLTIWISGWIQRGWKTSDGKDVANRDLIEETTIRLAKFKSYIISYVAAHTGKDDDLSRNNDIVDKMAVRVLNPSEEVKVITTNTEEVFPQFPLQLMGPAISERMMIDWCLANTDKLDRSAYESALLTGLAKTIKKKGFNLEKQKLHRTNMYKLTSANHLITELTKIEKEE
jgi:ribonuclease HI